jgi:translation elongation factor EF-4
MVVKLRELIPRQQFDIPVETAIGKNLFLVKRLKRCERCYCKMLWW